MGGLHGLFSVIAGGIVGGILEYLKHRSWSGAIVGGILGAFGGYIFSGIVSVVNSGMISRIGGGVLQFIGQMLRTSVVNMGINYPYNKDIDMLSRVGLLDFCRVVYRRIIQRKRRSGDFIKNMLY